MINCIAIDDEKPALDLLADNIKNIPFLTLKATCKNAIEAMQVLSQHSIDLIFLDIQMPGLTGLQFVQSLTHKPMVIFITAYEKYAIDGFNLDVVDYLLKPVPLDRFIKACNKAYALHTAQYAKSVSNIKPAEHLFVNIDSSMLKIDNREIIFIEAQRDYIKIHLAGTAMPLITRMPMKAMEKKLPAGKFIRIHKSYIIAVKQITSIKKDSILVNNHELPIGEMYKENLRLLTGS